MGHQFPLTDQTEEKKGEGLRGWWVDVSRGFLIGWFRRTQYITSIGLIYNVLEGCGMLPTVKIFLEIFWEGINDTPGADFPIESIKLC